MCHPRSMYQGHAGAHDDVWGILGMCLDLLLGITLSGELQQQVQRLLDSEDPRACAVIRKLGEGLERDSFAVTVKTLVFAGQVSGHIGAHLSPPEVRALTQSCDCECHMLQLMNLMSGYGLIFPARCKLDRVRACVLHTRIAMSASHTPVLLCRTHLQSCSQLAGIAAQGGDAGRPVPFKGAATFMLYL